MGVASLVLGIISLVLGWIPFLCIGLFIFAILGLILGIVDTVKKNKAGVNRGVSVAGIITNAVAIPIIIVMSIVSLVIIGVAIDESSSSSTYKNRKNYNYNYNYNNRYHLNDWVDNYNNLDINKYY